MIQQTLILIITCISCIIIIGAFIWAWNYVSQKDNDEIKKYRQRIEQLPSLLSTLGVLGTFIGITIGLYFFKPESLDSSIKELLEGLKTAFVTSLLGMVSSLILNRKISHVFDDLDDEESEIVTASNKIVDAIQRLQRSTEQKLDNAISATKDLGIKNNEFKKSIELITASIDQIRDDVEEIKGSHELIRETQNEIQSSINGIANDKTIEDEVKRLRAIAMTATASLTSMDNAISDINDSTKSASKKLDQITEYIDDEIERKH